MNKTNRGQRITRYGLMAVLLGLLLVVFAQRKDQMDNLVDKSQLESVLKRYLRWQTPGLQYVVVDANQTLFEYAGGWADIARQKPMTPQTTMMAYSMTKTLTAVAVLQLVQEGKLGLDDPIDRYLTNHPYVGQPITVRQLLTHTSGLPNPIPIRWVHLMEEDKHFDEAAELAKVLRNNPTLASEPGHKYAYSNIGYWLLGKIIEQVTGQPYTKYMKAKVIAPLGQPLDFVISDSTHHANGYLARYSMLNLIKGFVMDSKFFAGYEGSWLRLKSHHLNGPAFGGLVGTARSFAAFLQDQLQPQSVLFDLDSKRLFETQQTNREGELVPMTLGWHVGETMGVPYLFKEGGGGGFHTEMRLYPSKGIASVVMVNSTEFNSRRFLNRLDAVFVNSE